MSTSYARVAVRNTGDLILGKNFALLIPGHVYELQEHLGEVVLKDLGLSCCSTRATAAEGLTWDNPADMLIASGVHLRTTQEEIGKG